MHRFVGYMLSGDTSYEVFACFYGTGANGKTTLLNLLQSVLGKYATEVDVEVISARRRDAEKATPALLRLAGTRLVRTAEPLGRWRLDTGLVKRIASGHNLRARGLNEGIVEFPCQAKLVIEANHRPIVDGSDSALFRRLALVEFGVEFPGSKRDTNLGRKLNAERAGVLRWAIEGWRRMREQGLSLPPSMKAAVARFQEESDLFAEFFDSYLLVSPGSRVPRPVLHALLRRLCAEQDVRGVPKASGMVAGLKKLGRRREFVAEPGVFRGNHIVRGVTVSPRGREALAAIGTKSAMKYLQSCHAGDQAGGG